MRSFRARAECRKSHCASVFSELTDEEFAELQDLMVPIEYEAGKTIHHEGMLASGVYVICKGRVKYGKSTADRSRSRILRLLGVGDLLGLEALFFQSAYCLSGFAKAMEDTQVVFIEKGKFFEFLERHPRLWRRLCEYLSREILIYQCKLSELAYEPMRVNLARLLLMLAHHCGVRGNDGVEIEFRRKDLAEFAGTHTDTLNRSLCELKEKGLIDIQHEKIKILDESALKRLASPLTTCLKESLL